MLRAGLVLIVMVAVLGVACSCVFGVPMTATVVAVSGTTVVDSNGTVWVWGGECYATTNDPWSPARFPGLGGVTAVASGGRHKLALRNDGTVWAWGENNYGQLGDGTTIERSTVVQVSGLSGVTAVEEGVSHSVALKGDGTVWTWGRNNAGQLGDGTTDDKQAPVQVLGLTDVVAIAAGGIYTVALRTDGTLWAWGGNASGELGNETTGYINPVSVQVSGLSGVVSVATGNSHTVAVKSDGTVWAWGYNTSGQLGNGATSYINSTPIQVPGLVGVVAAAAGGDSTAVLKEDGRIFAWGNNSGGQTGDGIGGNRLTPVEVLGITGTVSLLVRSSCFSAITSDGTLWTWGDNSCGQLGDGTTTYKKPIPVAVAGVSEVVAVSGGYRHLLILRRDSTVWSCGQNNFGQIGDGSKTDRNPATQISGLTAVVAVAAGSYHSLALRNDGTVWAWGYNYRGQIGDGTTKHRYTPQLVSGIDSVVAIAAGDEHSMALRSDGTVWAWGSNGHGRLGDGTTSTRLTPVEVSGVTGVAAIEAGYDHSVALKSDGAVWAWGCNAYGQLADDTTADRPTPVQVAGFADATAIAAGDGYTVALKNDGTVWAWGNNGSGQLGDGSKTRRLTPTRVVGLTDVVSVAAGCSHSVARKSDGTLWAWGYNGYGQLGDRTLIRRLTPVQVLGIDGITQVTAEADSTAALKNDGLLWAWGSNDSGALGDGNFRNTHPLPVHLDLTAPTGTVTINSDAAFTQSSIVSLGLSPVDDSNNIPYMSISNDGLFDTETWGSYSATKTYVLPGGKSLRTVYVKFRDAAGNESDVATDSIVLGTPTSAAQAKGQGTDGVMVLAGQVVTAKFPDCIYVESLDRSSGIRVSPAPADADVGELIDVAGTATTSGGEKTLSLLTWKVQPGSGSVAPLGLANVGLGGGDWLHDGSTGAGQRGVHGWQWVQVQPDVWEHQWLKSQHLNNIGLLVRTWGKAVEVETVMAPTAPTWFKIDDGSDSIVRVTVPEGVTVPGVDSFVCVTGISSCEESGADLVRLLRVRQQSDIAP